MRKLFLRWLPLLIAVTVLAALAGRAQGLGQPGPRILSGGDIGFRVEGTDRAGKPVGTWVVRLDGQWVEATAKATSRPAD